MQVLMPAPLYPSLLRSISDGKDKGDTALEDLAPFLAALVNEGVENFPALFAALGTNKSEELAQVYNDKVYKVPRKQPRAPVRSIAVCGSFYVSARGLTRHPRCEPGEGEARVCHHPRPRGRRARLHRGLEEPGESSGGCFPSGARRRGDQRRQGARGAAQD